MAAYCFLASKRRIRDNHNDLSLLLLAQSTEEKVLDKQFAEWEKDI